MQERMTPLASCAPPDFGTLFFSGTFPRSCGEFRPDFDEFGRATPKFGRYRRGGSLPPSPSFPYGPRLT
jgi:hypothetical protein